jgi:hypothetical protein
MVRKMGDYDVVQRIQDGYFDANLLLHQWNNGAENPQRKMESFLSSPKTREFMDVIKAREGDCTVNFAGSVSGSLSGFGQIRPYSDNQTVSGFRVVIVGKRKKDANGIVAAAPIWMHPLLFIDFSMWISPQFKYDVLKFVYDKMIQYRHESGDEYVRLGKAVDHLVGAHFFKVAICRIAEAVNWIVFNKHEKNIRNQFGNEEQQRELSELERKITSLIEEGFITSYNQLIDYLRKRYHEKNYPKIFREKPNLSVDVSADLDFNLDEWCGQGKDETR